MPEKKEQAAGQPRKVQSFVTSVVPPTQKQCKKLYKQLLKRAENEGRVAEVINWLSEETTWRTKLQVLLEQLEIAQKRVDAGDV